MLFRSRAVRRAQEQSLREAIRDDDWEGWLIPTRYECSDNDVWGWGRDGKQRPMFRSREYNNPYAHWFARFATEEEIFKNWEERKQRNDDFIAYASRK